MKEVGKIMGIPNVTTNTEGWFKNHSKTMKKILSKMSDAEKNALNKEAEEMVENGMPEDYQRK